MKYSQQTPDGKDPQLWETAQKRASFKRHLVTYLIVNSFLWAMWYFNYGHVNITDMDQAGRHYPWPLWPTLGWGIGLAFHYAGAYIFPQANSVEREYEKLKNEQNRK